MDDRFKSQVNKLDDLANHYVYILNTKRFFGYEPNSNPKRLREYTYAQVRDLVEKAFTDDTGVKHVFIDNAITDNTTLLIVPDGWDRALPPSAKPYAKNLTYMHFAQILHPHVTSPSEMAALTVPHDAAYRVLEREQKTKPPKDAFFLDKVEPDALSKRWEGWKYSSTTRPVQLGFAAASPDMATTATTTRKREDPWQAFAPSMITKAQSDAWNAKVADTNKKIDAANAKFKTATDDMDRKRLSMQQENTNKLEKLKADYHEMMTASAKTSRPQRSKSVDRKTHKMHGANVSMKTTTTQDEEDEQAYQKAWEALLKRSTEAE